MKKILIDGRFIGVGDSMGRYVIEVLQNILEIDQENQYSLLIRPVGWGLVRDYDLKRFKNLKFEVLDIPHYSLAEQTKLLTWLNKKPYDLVHFIQFNHPIFYRKPFIVTIHDLTTLGYLHEENYIKAEAFKRAMRSAVYDSKKIIAISETTKNEVLTEYPKISAQKIAVTRLGVNNLYLRVGKLDLNARRKLGDKFKNHYQIEGNYLLYTGMWKRHKNLIRALQAFEKLGIDGFQFVIVGKIDREQPDVIAEIERINGHLIDESNSKDPVFITGFVDEDLLPASYAGACAYVQCSLNEGFGLPPLESMACGTPVIASNASVMPEVLADAALYFDPYNVSDIRAKMEKIIQDKKLWHDLRDKGLVQAGLYRWSQTGRETLAVYKEVLGI